MRLHHLFRLFFIFALCLATLGAEARPVYQIRHQTGVVYGQADGRDLTMDVFYPNQNANGKGLICVVSGGFFSGRPILAELSWLLEAIARQSGYTVFAVMHGSPPEFVVPEMVPQITRAVRYIRHHGSEYKIDPERLGIMGFSSGGYLALMMGVKGDGGNPAAADPVERAPSRVQAVVAFFPPTDFLNYGGDFNMSIHNGLLGWFRGMLVKPARPKMSLEDEKAVGRAVSPRYYVSAGSAPTLLIHGDRDPLVPLQQSEIFLKAMRQAGAECSLRVKRGAGHGWHNMAPDLREAADWFDRHLGGAKEK